MKYCPFCGASLLSNTAAFCAECGKKLPKKTACPTNTPAQMQPRRATANKQKTKRVRPSPQRERVNDGYDGYYDDVLPVDIDTKKGGLDPELLKRVGIVVAGAVGVIALAAILMFLL